MEFDFLALAGGAMIGAAALVLWLGLGRIAGVSGIIANSTREGSAWRWAFLLGLLGAGVVASVGGGIPDPTRPTGVMLLAGLLVGIGTVVGNGCTSGHGVCGIGRLSKRSLVATCVFMATGGITVWIWGGAV